MCCLRVETNHNDLLHLDHLKEIILVKDKQRCLTVFCIICYSVTYAHLFVTWSGRM